MAETLVNRNQIEKENLPNTLKMTTAGETITLLKVTTNDIFAFTKDNDGQAYCGIYYLNSSSKIWQMPILVSETKNNCAMTRTGASVTGVVPVSDTTFSYKDKNWYYTLDGYAVENPSPCNDGRYIIANGKIFSGSNYVIEAAKALLDYIYTFNI